MLDKIGMRNTLVSTDRFGDFILSSQVYTNARDLARFGLLYLQGGVWNGERLVSEDWIDFVRTPAPATAETGNFYGGQFWLVPDGRTDVPKSAYSTSGNRGQYVVIVPTHDLVIVRRGLDYGRQGFDRWSLTREVLKAIGTPPTQEAERQLNGSASHADRAPAERGDDVVLGRRDRLDRQPRALLRHHHLLEARRLLQGREGDGGGEALDEREVHHVPDRLVLRAAGVEVLVAGLPRVVVGIAGAADRGEPADPRRVRVRRVEQDAVALLHHVAHEVARLEVAHPFPAGPAVAFQVVYRVGGRLAFHQPVAFGHLLKAPRKTGTCVA